MKTDIEQIKTDQLIPYARNARTHSEAQVAQIAGSIREFGFCNPVLIDADDGIIAGHGRVMAAQKLGMNEVPCVRLDHLSKTQRRAYIIADNKLALKAEWNMELLGMEFDDLKAEGFDLELTGFDEAELLEWEDEPGTEGDTEPQTDRAEELREQWGVEEGQLWAMGEHRLLCGDSTKSEDVARVMMGETASFIYSDAPYGISIVNPLGKVSTGLPVGPALCRINKEVGGIHKGMKARPIIQSNVYAPVIGDDNGETARESFTLLHSLFPKAVHVWWGANHFSDVFPPSSCWIVWDKQNGESFFADAELAYCSAKTAVRIFRHTWNGLIKESEKGQKRVHPTQKPVALAEWCFESYGNSDDIVLDPFSGSGTTIIACENLKRKCRAIELSPGYVAVALQRWADHTGKTPTLINA